ncbi:DNA repair REX1-B-domain-containing protein [Syncephalastrum racemosum]|uniref:DNA repair REX1-B-domain-containing protein n=1 Tax=Syncephalastrum racemosum TaxID=13706 RepID=A0A1X2HJJ6_SYNRA|nr:DNA repair REX1-B-domain-containing protein [Syncephalastrum racemosum]
MVNASLADAMRALLKAQSTRVALYKEFDDAFKDFLNTTCSAEEYQLVCTTVTQGFQEVSTEIQAIEAQVTAGRPDIAGLIRQLQNLEKDKLYMTCRSQILTIEARETDKDLDEPIQDLKTSLETTLADITEVWDAIREEATELAYA